MVDDGGFGLLGLWSHRISDGSLAAIGFPNPLRSSDLWAEGLKMRYFQNIQRNQNTIGPKETSKISVKTLVSCFPFKPSTP